MACRASVVDTSSSHAWRDGKSFFFLLLLLSGYWYSLTNSKLWSKSCEGVCKVCIGSCTFTAWQMQKTEGRSPNKLEQKNMLISCFLKEAPKIQNLLFQQRCAAFSFKVTFFCTPAEAYIEVVVANESCLNLALFISEPLFSIAFFVNS